MKKKKKTKVSILCWCFMPSQPVRLYQGNKKKKKKKKEERSLDRMYFQCPNEKDEVMSCAQCAPRLIMGRRLKVMTRKS